MSSVLTFLLITSPICGYACDVKFFLFKKNNPNNVLQITSENASKYITTTNNTSFIIHGWDQSWTVPMVQDLKNALFQHPVTDVIAVDFEKIARQNYVLTTLEGPCIGTKVANFIMDLNYPLDKLHLIGHSFGGHISGIAGKRIFDVKGKKLGRITALDPAGPMYSGLIFTGREKLEKTDAEVVLVIHTNTNFFGYSKPCGTADIFPNGGDRQPSCLFSTNILCSHHMSYHFFISAVKHPKSLFAQKCESYKSFQKENCNTDLVIIDVGDLTTTAEGLFYLTATNA